MNTSKISSMTGGSMIAFAVLFDSLDLLLGLGAFGFVVDIVASLLFGIWFSHYDVSLLHPDRALKFLGTIVVEAIPFGSSAPMFSYTVISTVRAEWRRPLEE